MRIAGIRVTNFERFRGEHEADLGPGVYAIIARHESNPDRSNWLGKSSLLSAVRFALHGSVRSDTLDGVISHGESNMAVDLELSNGLFVSRSRARGKSTQLRVLSPNGGRELEFFQAEAQAEIIRQIGLSEAEWLATSWCEQGMASHLVRTTPAERTEIVNGWLALEPLEVAAGWARRMGLSVETERARVNGQISSIEQELSEPIPADAEIAELEAIIAKAKSDREAWKAKVEARSQWRRKNEKREEWEELVERLATERNGFAALPKPKALAPFEEAYAGLTRAAETACEAYETVSSLAAGEFSGFCPVTETLCPSSEHVRATCTGNKSRVVKAKAAATEAVAAEQRARVAFDKLRSEHRAYEEARQSVAALETRVKVEPPDPGVEPGAPEDSADATWAVEKLAMLRERMGRRATLEKTRDELVEKLSDLNRARRAYFEAGSVLGRGGAQRRVAEGAVQAIEREANRRLSRVGIDLRVAVQWGREIKGLASNCDACGVAFPKHQKAVPCENCGAARGPKRDDRLYLDLTDRSGAAEDLAGLVIQLSAAAWLQGRKQSPWSVVALDEPFGQLDPENRRSFARCVQALAGEGFDQAFVIAHSADILEALPNRIVVTGGDKWSRFRVE